MTDPPIFIVGCPRSGTGLLRDLLRSHPRLTFPSESHFIPSFYRGYGDPVSADEARRLAGRILRIRWVRRWGLPLSPGDFAADRTFRAVLERFYRAWATKEGKPRWGDKTPHYVRAIPLLLELFPEARVIHIIRDGRDVALSWLATRLEPRNLFTAAAAWRDLVGEGRQAGRAARPGAYLEIRYERLITDPEPVMREVCAFVGESFLPAVLRPTGLGPILPAGSPRPPRVSEMEVVGGNRDKWRRQMPSKDRVLFETIAGDLLAELGYEIEGATRSVSAVERAWWQAHHAWLWSLERLNPRYAARMATTDLRLRWAKMRRVWSPRALS
jgi:Sulfotransferase family